MPFRAVIFDLDDTLLDSSALRAQRDAGNWRGVFARLADVQRFEVAGNQPAVTDLPRLARSRGMAVGLLTHSPRQYASELLRMHGIVVDAMVSGSDGYPRKPDPTGLKALLSELDVCTADTLTIGDSVLDFGAAAAAGTMSVGVSWHRLDPVGWRHRWPDFAAADPGLVLNLLDDDGNLGLWGEVMADGDLPNGHWGSLMRLGEGTFGLGRYFPMGDTRYPRHELSHLVLRAKENPEAAAEVAAIFAQLAADMTTGAVPDLVLSVPPSPGGHDRFAQTRAALADVWGARSGDGLLTMKFPVDEYRHISRETRAGCNIDRFECAPLNGEHVVLIDDVLTSGGQSQACKAAIQAAGGGPVTILVLAVTQDKLSEPCPQCGASLRTFTRRRDGQEFIGCSAWSVTGCSYTRDLAR